MICERFDVDPERAAQLDAHPTWSLVIDAMIQLMAYRDTYVRWRNTPRGKSLPGDLPHLKTVNDNAFEMTSIRAAQRRAERERERHG